MSQTFTTFKKFPDAGSARNLQQLLLEKGIESRFVDNSPSMGNSISGELDKEYELQVAQDDFVKAETILINQAKELLDEIPEGHYLLDFTTEELYDIVLKREEWSDYDYLLARKLLEERGKTIDDELLASLREQRLADLAKPEQNQKAWVAFGYIAALAGGFFGIITGYVLWTSRKTLPNGDIVPTYNATDRMHGKTIFILGLIILPVSILIKLLDFNKL